MLRLGGETVELFGEMGEHGGHQVELVVATDLIPTVKCALRIGALVEQVAAVQSDMPTTIKPYGVDDVRGDLVQMIFHISLPAPVSEACHASAPVVEPRPLRGRGAPTPTRRWQPG